MTKARGKRVAASAAARSERAQLAAEERRVRKATPLPRSKRAQQARARAAELALAAETARLERNRRVRERRRLVPPPPKPGKRLSQAIVLALEKMNELFSRWGEPNQLRIRDRKRRPTDGQPGKPQPMFLAIARFRPHDVGYAQLAEWLRKIENTRRLVDGFGARRLAQLRIGYADPDSRRPADAQEWDVVGVAPFESLLARAADKLGGSEWFAGEGGYAADFPQTAIRWLDLYVGRDP